METQYRRNIHEGRKKAKVPIFGIIILLIVIGFSLAIIFSSGREKKVKEKERLWINEDCRIDCQKDDFIEKPLLVISFDGFKRSYIDKHIVKTLENMAECGTSAEYMYGTYPTKTFPNHYSIATGLFPESHGIVDNVIYDDRIKTEFINIRRTKDAQYFNGIPIWNVLEQQNIKTACIFWPGCDSLINDMQPTYNVKYNRSMPYQDRIDQIVSWLEMPASIRPMLIMAYFNQPDFTVHFKENEKISKELKQIDSILDYLFNTLQNLGTLNCINTIILSDHGMQKIDYRYYMDGIIDTKDILFADGVVAQIYFPEETNTTLQDKIMKTMEELKCPDNANYRVYDKQRIPIRYHFRKSNRIGDIILDGQLGTVFYENYAADYNKTYDHGYDFILPSMHAIFFAFGPNIVRSLVLKPFQNVELFNLMLALLKVNPDRSPSNNGTNGRLNNVLDNIPINKPQRLEPLKECTISDKIEKENKCLHDLSFLVSGNKEMCYLPDCSNILQSALIKRSDSNFTIALIERISSTSSISRSLPGDKSSEWLATSLSIKDTNELKVNLHHNFVKGHFIDLEEVTSEYAELFNEIVVISGPIYDFNDEASRLHSQRNSTPSHIFRVIFRCKDSKWLKSEFQCEDTNSLDVLSFILPNVPGDYNCLDPLSYLSTNRARLRDIELLTGLEFLPTSRLPEEQFYSDEFSVTLRTLLPEDLWMIEG